MKGTLKVLMLKHLLVRVHRFINTTLELLSPVLFFIILYIFKDKINEPKPLHARNELNIYNTEPIPLESVRGPSLIYYMPDTDLTGLLMDRVGDKLGLERLKYFPRYPTSGYYPIANLSDLADSINSMGEHVAVVVFQDNMSGTWPKNLNYTIRIKADFMTHLYNPQDGGVGPHERFGTIYEPFMRLQWAIDTSYLQLLLQDVNINQTVTLQEFPYVNMNEDINQVIVILSGVLAVMCWLSLLLVFVFLMSRLLEERISGIEELIKMSGVSGNTLGISHFLNVVPTGLMYCVVNTALLTASANPLIPSSNPLLIGIILALHFVSVIAMAFACSYFVKNTQYAVTLSLFVYVALWVPSRLAAEHVPRSLRALAGLLPHAPLRAFWEELATLERFGQGLTFSNMATTHGANSFSVLLSMLFFIVQSAVFFLLAWYLSHVNPGPYGQALPWGFIFQRQYWNQKKITPETEFEESEEPITQDPLFFEEAPKNLEAGIKIVNVTKAFPKKLALSNVSLDIYKGEITVLLGHNGAGKTTLMNIITGMISATSGKVYVEGFDNVTQKDKVRKLLGLCPQHNLFFPDLTVLEHIIFFSMLKGTGYRSARAESRELVRQLGLAGKESSRSGQLSGGMKRRLQLACALAGRAQVLVLDEPTSGLDVETRRSLWDLLLSLRGDRCVLLSTHFMEEADALGDRVAALHAGRLRCHATTMHLKRALGTGYRLSFTTIGVPKEEAITKVVKSQVTDASVKEKSLNTITYNLPAKNSSNFPQLFKTLESKRSELAIDSIGVGISTLEEVFLKLCSDIDTTFTQDGVDGGSVEPTYNTVTGVRLYWQQLLVLLKRQVKYLLSKKMSVLILQVIMPILTLGVFTYMSNNPHYDVKRNSVALMDLNMYEDLPERRVLYNINTSDTALRTLTDHYKDVVFEKTDDVVASLLAYGKKDIVEYNKYLVGIELNDTDAKVLFTTRVRHAAPAALSLLREALAARLAPRSLFSGQLGALATYNQPLADPTLDNSLPDQTVQPKDTVMAAMWATVVVFVVLATNINLVSLPCKERRSGARRLHVLAGCGGALHWAATLLAHAALCVLTLLLPALLLAACLDAEATLSQPDLLGTMFVVLLLGSLSFFSFMYLVSFYFGERGSSTVLVGCIIIFGFLTTSMKTVDDIFKGNQDKDFSHYILTLCGYIAPPHTLTIAAMKTVNVARLNAYCTLNKHKCPRLFVPDEGFDTNTCCILDSNPRCYFCIDNYSPGESMLIMFFQFVVYMTLVILTQNGVFNRLADRLFNQRYSPKYKDDADEMVRAEKTYVSQAITLPPNQIQEAMLVDDIHKNYVQLFKKSCNAVKGVSFSVKNGECFGLLGVNGAGKSTTFKMLTAEECPTRGTIFANGQHLKKNRGKYLQSLGYCPQFFGLDDFLSGYDNLALLLTLRGLSAEDVKNAAKSWIEVVGLQASGARRAAGYSGGMARRLAAGAALCTGARVALLDEPTAGVDVSARRRVWAALRRALAARRATLVTSHSMDEMEALCSRIAIMSGGRVRALGSAAALRAAHAQGHAVQLKLRPAPALAHADVTDSAKSDVQRLKSELHQKFNCQLKDEHKTMLHYHINETMRYSDLFTELETLKNSNPIVEDYSVTETTLEEVFLSFAKETHDEADEIAVTTV
ncbi:unnamed protein product [Parnassius mnemosyne]|uniref:ABC transporter domain-containing protein n=1 Tax=Parnassius mnemosyne TaxID=213953 RepID=A0AAV1KRL5_9NEOP